MSNFDQVIKSVLNATLIDKGYIYEDDCYFLNGSDSLTYCIGFDFVDNSYRVFIGVHRRSDGENFDKPPEGAYLSRYFTGGSLSSEPKDFKFRSEDELRKYLVRLNNNFDNLIFPFFDSASNLEQYADELSVVECMVSYEIYQELNLKEKALQEGKIVLEQYKNMRDIPAIDGRLNQISEFIDSVE
jgi:hypothetical protein